MDEPTKPANGIQDGVPFPSSTPRARPFGRGAWIAIVAGAVALLGLASVGIHQYIDSTHKTTFIPASRPVASADVPPGWSQYREPASGFAIQLPPGWNSIGIDLLKDRALLEAKYPEFAAKVKQYGDPATVATHVKFFALSSGATVTFVILKQTGDAISLDDYVTTVRPNFDKLGAQQLEHHRATLSAGEAERFAFTLTITGADGQPTNLRYVQYHVLTTSGAQTTLFVLQFTVHGDSQDPSDATLDQVASSFKLM